MQIEKIIEHIDELETDGIDDEVGIEFERNGAVTKEEWESLTIKEKVELAENLEIYEHQDYYIGFYSALEMLRRFILKK